MRNPIVNEKPFTANSVAGSVKITHHALIDLFELGRKLKFFILPTLKNFDGIIGNDSLKELGATIHTNKGFMTITQNLKIPLKQHFSDSVNNLNINNSHLNRNQIQKLEAILSRCPTLFSEPDEKLTYVTNVKGEIRTINSDPVYSRPYPYPMCLKEEVDKQIDQLLTDGIIRPSKSPYNSPVWIVPKKVDASGERKYRMVIDYRKLNTVTIPDRYPIPEINDILSNLGKNQFFTVIDLKSGFHQIPLKESDIEKTAFSVNHGKFEFTRLPFGLKNGPSIFQRALDDILRNHIGKRCYIYIDDIIIFGEGEEQHFENLEQVFKTLENANMKVQLEKCKFLQSEVEFLGFIISKSGIKANPDKVKTIANFPLPRNIKELRSFLGMSGFYRRFIKDYAKLAKPLTSLLREEDGHVSKNFSKTKQIVLSDEQKDAFHKIKNSLTSDEVLLSFPDFQKEFELTTDASNFALGAVLSQNGKPITFLSRTLNKAEENYAANEKEMLAIIWALTSLRNFLYGSRKVKIFTDHQPLTYALSNKNNNSKMKRWKAILEEYNYELKYKPGKSNIVADALSRIPATSKINSLSVTQHSDESSSHDLIPTVEIPVNVFRNQIILNIGDEDSYQKENPFPNYSRHIFTKPEFTNTDVIAIFRKYLNPNTVNGLKTTESIMGRIQEIYPLYFRDYKIRFTQKLVVDITNEDEQDEKILSVHRRAHRNAQENKDQIIEKYYFPKMSKKIKFLIKRCVTCKENKYERHPNNQIIEATPIPSYPGHTLHIDIFSTEKKLVLTAIDKFTKLAFCKVIKSRAIEDIKQPLRDILFFFSVPEVVIIDNEKALNSKSIMSMMEDGLKIKVFKTPPYKSEVNGQIERFHSTLAEIMRCLNYDRVERTFEQLLERSVNEYNHTIHSATGKRPVELYYGRVPNASPEQLENIRLSNIEKLKKKQEKDLNFHNKTRKPVKTYQPGQIIYVKHNKRLGSKLTVRYDPEIVEENRNTTVLTKSGKVVHKSHIRN